MEEDIAEEQDEEPINNSSLWRKILVWVVVILMVTWSIGRFFIWNK